MTNSITIAGITITENSFLPPDTVVILGDDEIATAKGGPVPNEEGEIKVLKLPKALPHPPLEIKFYDSPRPVDLVQERLKRFFRY